MLAISIVELMYILRYSWGRGTSSQLQIDQQGIDIGWVNPPLPLDQWLAVSLGKFSRAWKGYQLQNNPNLEATGGGD